MTDISRSLRVATVVPTVSDAVQFASDHASEFTSFPAITINPFQEIDGNGEVLGTTAYSVTLSGMAAEVEPAPEP